MLALAVVYDTILNSIKYKHTLIELSGEESGITKIKYYMVTKEHVAMHK